MASYYWDPHQTSTSTSGTATNSTRYNNSASSTTTNWYYVTAVVTREMLIEEPEHWEDSDRDGFTRLVNLETKTGWIVKLWIKGDVCITDPTIERRSMADFLPLLRSSAKSVDDLTRINDFFDAHPLSKPKE